MEHRFAPRGARSVLREARAHRGRLYSSCDVAGRGRAQRRTPPPGGGEPISDSNPTECRRAATEQRVGLADWALTIPFLLTFGAVLLLFDPLQRFARLFGRRPHENVAGALQWCLVASLRLCGTTIEVDRAAGVRPGTGYVLIANHQSMLDVPMFGALLFSNYPKYVAKRELARFIPSISYNLRRGGNALIDRSDRASAEQTIAELGARAQERGVSVVIYPEGTRARRGELGPFRPKGTLALLAAAPDLDVVPVAIDGSWHLLEHNLLPVPRRTRIRIRFADPIPRALGCSGTELLEKSRAEIERTLERWRSDEAAGSSAQPPRSGT